MKTSTAIIIAAIFFGSCANDGNKDKGNETATPVVTPSSTVASDSATAHGDTIVQPNGVGNGTVVVDSANNK